MSRFARGLLVLILALVALPAFAAPVFPALTGRVVDEAKIIQPADKAALEAKLAGIEKATGRQMVIATIADMRDYPLDDYTYQLGRAWGIGGKGANDGLIILLAPNNPAGQRGPRIEVGYGLEAVVTDAFSAQLAKQQMTPRLRQGDIAGALNVGVDALAAQIRLTPEEAAKRAQATAQGAREQNGSVNVGTLFFWGFVFLFVILPMLARGARGKRHRCAGGIGEALLWTAINVAANSRGSGSGWSSGSGGDWGGGGGGGFSGGGGSFGGGGASGDW